MYFLQEAIVGGMMFNGLIILTVTTGFSLLACFIFWSYKKFTKTAETATESEPVAIKRKPGALPYIILILLVIFITLVAILLNISNTTYE